MSANEIIMPLAATKAVGMPLAVQAEPKPQVVNGVLEAQVTEIVKHNAGDFGLAMTPRDAIAQATVAARALTDVIEARPTKVVINGKTYLTLEDWQLVAHFYGMSAKVKSTTMITISDAEGPIQGYEASAEVINMRTGQVIGGGEGMCMNDESKWRNKPLYALRSMAQTRACAKALRSVLAFVPVLAGYSPTPAEEMGKEISG